jgi:hypothetical protein
MPSNWNGQVRKLFGDFCRESVEANSFHNKIRKDFIFYRTDRRTKQVPRVSDTEIVVVKYVEWYNITHWPVLLEKEGMRTKPLQIFSWKSH